MGGLKRLVRQPEFVDERGIDNHESQVFADAMQYRPDLRVVIQDKKALGSIARYGKTLSAARVEFAWPDDDALPAGRRSGRQDGRRRRAAELGRI
jgi:hypothetical protein